ncbi:nucleotide exchange factor GrpE [Balneola sp. MJW-20]|uniref:nucleotide exchange factor GrpE n=1 Tax=Gracilimonas aurantiaca TaxID=3234185 RepID=UPI003466C709
MAEEKDKSLKEEETVSEEVAEEAATAEESGTEEENELSEAESRILELEEQLASTKDSLLRKAAELENVRKRVQRERLQLFEEAKAGALEDFLPVNDDLIRTMQAAEESDLDGSFMEGLKLVSDKFSDVLEKHGVKRIDETGVPFDVNLHDAMMKQPSEDMESDMVLQVIESGYKIGDRTIRHAKVIVSE